MTPTAEEFLTQNYAHEGYGGDRLYSWYDCMEAMIEFAKLHVEQALKTASEEATHSVEIDWMDPYDYSAGHNGIKGGVDKYSILEAYLLENIK